MWIEGMGRGNTKMAVVRIRILSPACGGWISGTCPWFLDLQPIRSVTVGALVSQPSDPTGNGETTARTLFEWAAAEAKPGRFKKHLRKKMIGIHAVGYYHIKYLVYLTCRTRIRFYWLGREKLYTGMLFMYLYVPLHIVENWKTLACGSPNGGLPAILPATNKRPLLGGAMR